MNVTIQQHKCLLRSEYDIQTPACIYFAQKNFFSFRDVVKLFGSHGHLLATIKGRFLSFRSKYELDLTDGGIYHFLVQENVERHFPLRKRQGVFPSLSAQGT